MPRFFLSIADGETYEDREGQELPDRQSALDAAMKAARELIAEGAREGHIPLQDKIVVTDDAGEVVGVVAFRDAVEIEDEQDTASGEDSA